MFWVGKHNRRVRFSEITIHGELLVVSTRRRGGGEKSIQPVAALLFLLSEAYIVDVSQVHCRGRRKGYTRIERLDKWNRGFQIESVQMGEEERIKICMLHSRVDGRNYMPWIKVQAKYL